MPFFVIIQTSLLFLAISAKQINSVPNETE